MQKLYAALLAAIVLLGLSACDNRHQHDSTRQVSWLSRCPDFSATGKAPVEQNAECGSLVVKENPQDANSASIALNVLRLPGVSPVPEADPLFIIAGGPGQSAVLVAETLHAVFNEVRKKRDIIFVDQRGTGKSNPFECEFEKNTDESLPETEQKRVAQAALAACISKYQGHWPYYTTLHAVADLDAVRAALGYNKINLWGGSYGSRVVLEYMRRFPAHTRASVIDGVAPAAIALPWYMEADGLAALQAINQQCAQTPACLAHYGDILAKANQVSAALLAKPVTVAIQHPRTEAKLNLTLNAQDFASVVHLALYNRELSALLPKVISDAAAGDYQLFGSLMYLAKARSDLADINYGMHYAVVCSEDYPLYQDKNFAESNQFLHSQMVQRYAEVCAQIPKATMPADYWEPVVSNLPVLVLSGAVDPVTPPHWAAQVMAGLTNATQVVAPGGHHIITGEGCIAQLIAVFINRGNGQQLEQQCAQQIQPLAIHLPAALTSSSEPAQGAAHDSH